MQRRALMSVELAQIDLFELSAAGAKDIEKVEFGGMATPTIGDQPGLCRAALRSIRAYSNGSPLPTNARAWFAASAYFSASLISRSMSLSDGRHPMPEFRAGSAPKSSR